MPHLHSNPESLRFGPFKLNVPQRRLERDGTPIKIGSRALDILALLTARSGEIVDKREILAAVWPGLTVEENTLRVHIKELRKALEDDRQGNRYIVNVPGRGYGFLREDEERSVIPSEVAVITSSRQSTRPHLTIIGRENESEAVSRLLNDKRFVTLHGPGGIGKTTLAKNVADRSLYQEAYFVDLGQLSDASLVPGAVATELGLASLTDESTEAVIRFLRDRVMLLILDSCEHVVDAVAELAETLFQSVPDLRLMATSREPLRVEGEHLFAVGPLALPRDAEVQSAEEIAKAPAISFFIEQARAGGASFELDLENLTVVHEICRQIDGIPLAIELAARRAGLHGLRETAKLVDSRLRLEWKGRRTAPPRHQTLNAMLDWSVRLVSSRERAVLWRISVLVGAFTLEHAEAIATDSELDGFQIAVAIDELVAKSLITLTSTERAHYRLLDTTRNYALQRLNEAGESELYFRRHADYCVIVLTSYLSRLPGDGPAVTRAEKAAFVGNVHAGLSWCFSSGGDRKLGIALAVRAVELFVDLSMISECRRWSETALDALTDDERGGIEELALQAALSHALMFSRGNTDHVQTALMKGLTIARSISDRSAEFRLLSRMHMFERRRGELDQLLPIANRALQISVELKDPIAEAASHVLLGVSHHLLGDQGQARFHLEHPVHHEPDVRQVTPNHFAFHRNPKIAIARALWIQGSPDSALEIAEDVMEGVAPLDAVTAAIVLIWATSVYQWRGDWEMVEKNASRLVDHAERNALRPYRAVGAGLLGEVALEVGETEAGIRRLREALGVLRAERYGLYTPAFACSLASGLARRGLFDQALPLIDETIAEVDRFGGVFNLPEVYRIRGEILYQAADQQQAVRSLQSAVALAERQKSLGWKLRAVTSLAKLPGGSGSGRYAIPALAETYARFDEGFDTADLIAARRVLEAGPV